MLFFHSPTLPMSIYFLGFGWSPLNILRSFPLFLIAKDIFVLLSKVTTVGSHRTKTPLSCPRPQTLLLF